MREIKERKEEWGFKEVKPEISNETEMQESGLTERERIIESEEDLLRTKEKIDKIEKHLSYLEENKGNQNEIITVKKGLNKLKR